MLLDPKDNPKVWEKVLRGLIPEIDLIGEIPFDEEDKNTLGECLRFCIDHYGATQTTNGMIGHYRTVLAVYMVAQGVYGYKGGDYWGDLCQQTGLPHQAYPQRWGEAFEDFLQRNRLRTFDELEGNRYLKAILAHGGIPNYCLYDFFAHLLQPAVEKDEFIGLDAQELIKEWSYCPSLLGFTDKPVRRFLMHGDRTAADFLDRCLEMARHAKEDGVVPSVNELHLPKRVVAAYEQWLFQREIRTHQSTSTQFPRFFKPIFSIEPWGNGPTIYLPSQHLDLDTPISSMSWLITVENHSTSFPIKGYQQKGYIETEEKTVILDRPAELYRVQILNNSQIIRSWEFQGISYSKPIMTFDPSTRRLIESSFIQTKELWVVYPIGYKLHDLTSGAVPRVIEEFPPLSAGWRRFEAEHIDLENIECVHLVASMGNPAPSVRLSISDSETILQPKLIGGNILSSSDTLENEIPIYIDEPPSLKIPVSDIGLHNALLRWTLTIRPRGNCYPNTIKTFRLADLMKDIQSDADPEYVTIPLTASCLLGRKPIGEFQVIARGPLGRDARFSFWILPYLKIDIPESLYLPIYERSDIENTISLSARSDIKIYLKEQEETKILHPILDPNNDGLISEYRLPLPLESNRIEVILQLSLPSGGTRELPLRIPIRRLQWALIGLDNTSVINWSSDIISIPREQLNQSEFPRLLVNARLGELQPLQANLIMMGKAENILQESGWQIIEMSRSRGRFSFQLNSFQDTINHSQLPSIEFRLHLLKRTNLGTTELSIPVLKITEKWVVANIEMQERMEDNSNIITLRWHETRMIKGRVARFWNLWRPWQPPFVISIADSNRGILEFERNTKSLSPGLYRIELAIEDAWNVALTNPTCPSKDSESTIDTFIGTKEGRILHLESLPDGALSHLERFLATSGTNRHTELQYIQERLQPQDIPIVLDFLLTFSSEKSKPDKTLQDLLKQLIIFLINGHPIEFIKVLSMRSLNISSEQRSLLVQLIVDIGIPQQLLLNDNDLESVLQNNNGITLLWELWPPMGLFIDSKVLSKYAEQAYSRVSHHLGKDSLKNFLPWRQGTSIQVISNGHLLRTMKIIKVIEIDVFQGSANYGVLPAPGLIVQLKDLDDYDQTAILTFSEESKIHKIVLDEQEEIEIPISQWISNNQDFSNLQIIPSKTDLPEENFFGLGVEVETRRSADHLRRIRDFCNLLPSGILDDQFYALSNAEWLIKVAENNSLRNEIEQWLRTESYRVSDDLARLIEHRIISSALYKCMLKRWFEPDINPLNNFPYMIGAIALIQRLLSWRPDAELILKINREEWCKFGQRAQQYAPDLYMHDLCLFELVLSWYEMAPCKNTK